MILVAPLAVKRNSFINAKMTRLHENAFTKALVHLHLNMCHILLVVHLYGWTFELF